ncbi:MAG: DUF1460 domain-containing protein [Candidatus Amulumruptor caecigallinarius]|nr:DUF1460 domain-containing protein [Candidatus Amulumruptor caecigallinarius]MCM1397406.1 DUF1460 domain-containing protein [Candidatus Amulumruptor caecigallinarius]MCM1454491.1 DUF1460 domain-containing protein [bacterium]
MKVVAALVAVAVCGMSAVSVAAALPQEVRWGDEARDIAKIDSLLRVLPDAGTAEPGALMVKVGESFIGTPYVAGTLEGSPDGDSAAEGVAEALTINTGELDCTTFVELAAAVVGAYREGAASWTDVAERLRDMRYRGGKVDGYASRHHYVSDWITENTYRGSVKEVTPEAPNSRQKALSLDFMTRHRDKYPVLADSATFERMRSVERGLRGIKTYFIPKATLGSKDAMAFMRDGDIVFITTSIGGLDVTHAGIIVKDSTTGEPHMLHASTRAGKVILDPQPLHSYLARNKTATGIRLVRLAR